MASTNLKSDSFCSYNQSAAPFYWIFEPGQYNNTYVFGEVGINAAGGSAGTYVRPDVIDVDSYLSGRDDILSKCNPPIPSLEDVAPTPMVIQSADTSILIAKDTRERRSATDLSSIDYNRWTPLPTNPQDLRFVIEGFSAQRGGMDTQNYTKLAWDPTIKKGAAVNGPKEACQTVLDPSWYCGDFCNTVSGNARPIQAMMPGKPQQNYPFVGITSQQIKSVGAANCGPQQFWGDNYTEGSCGNPAPQRMLGRIE
jgi:hypothetical protein